MPQDKELAILAGLSGRYCDELRGPEGEMIWRRDWRANAINVNCHVVLAGFMAGAPTTTFGIQGLLVGQGLDAWDATGAPPATSAQAALVDRNPYLAPRTAMQFTYLNGAAPSAAPTSRLQIVVTLGANMPTWPDANHATGSLREFGLVASLNGAQALINYVTHPVIVKDPASTLTRTIWLTF